MKVGVANESVVRKEVLTSSAFAGILGHRDIAIYLGHGSAFFYLYQLLIDVLAFYLYDALTQVGRWQMHGLYIILYQNELYIGVDHGNAGQLLYDVSSFRLIRF